MTQTSAARFRVVDKNFGPYIEDGSAGVLATADTAQRAVPLYFGIVKGLRTAELQYFDGDGWRATNPSDDSRYIAEMESLVP